MTVTTSLTQRITITITAVTIIIIIITHRRLHHRIITGISFHRHPRNRRLNRLRTTMHSQIRQEFRTITGCSREVKVEMTEAQDRTAHQGQTRQQAVQEVTSQEAGTTRGGDKIVKTKKRRPSKASFFIISVTDYSYSPQSILRSERSRTSFLPSSPLSTISAPALLP